jgi:hypothetical protein
VRSPWTVNAGNNDKVRDPMEQQWRGNVDPAWESFPSLCESASLAVASRNEFDRNKNLKAALLFSSIALEAFLNRLMRTHLEARQTPEKEIVATLVGPSLTTKLKTWPAKWCALPPTSSDSDELIASLDAYRALRNGITHPKERDHSIYATLERLDAKVLVTTVALTMVALCETRREQYPYWVLGWNFVGFNRDPAQPLLTDAAQFIHALARMGFLRPADALVVDTSRGWQNRWLSSRKGYSELAALLGAYSADIEPWFELIPGAGSPPRLCRRWWDRAFILSARPRST